MKTRVKELLVVAFMIVVAGTTWGADTADLPSDAYNVVHESVYSADGDVVGHVRVSWHKFVDLGYGFPCDFTIQAKVHLQQVDPSTTYEGWFAVGSEGGTCMASGGVVVKSNPGGAGAGEVVFGLRCTDQMPDFISLILFTPSGDYIQTGVIPLLR